MFLFFACFQDDQRNIRDFLSNSQILGSPCRLYPIGQMPPLAPIMGPPGDRRPVSGLFEVRDFFNRDPGIPVPPLPKMRPQGKPMGPPRIYNDVFSNEYFPIRTLPIMGPKGKPRDPPRIIFEPFKNGDIPIPSFSPPPFPFPAPPPPREYGSIPILIY